MQSHEPITVACEAAVSARGTGAVVTEYEGTGGVMKALIRAREPLPVEHSAGLHSAGQEYVCWYGTDGHGAPQRLEEDG